MSEAVKKLTVSYGAFSCTLEGFDDPFPVMKMVVDYFQSLAERDPSFGAHPERPDADYLRNLAQRGTNREVEIETQENGVVLRQSFDRMPETAEEAMTSRSAGLTLVPRAEIPKAATIAAADLADEMFESLELAEAETGPVAGKASAGGAADFFAASGETTGGDDYDREERALERLLTAARLRSGTDEVLAPGNPMQRIKESLEDEDVASRFADSAPAEALPDQEFVAELTMPEPFDAQPETVAVTKLEAVAETEEPAAAETEFAPDAPATGGDEPEIEMIGIGIIPVETPEPEELETTEDAAGEPAEISEPDQADSDEHEDGVSAEAAVADAAMQVPESGEPAMAKTAEDDLDDAAGLQATVSADATLAPESELAASAEAPAITDADAGQGMARAAAGIAAEIPEAAPPEAGNDPAEFDWQAENAEAEAEVAAAPAAPLSVLVLGPALMVVSGGEAVLEPAAETQAGAEDDTAEASEAAAPLRRQIVRARTEAEDFGYNPASRHAETELAGEPVQAAASEDDDYEQADDNSLSLDNFARKVGAASLPELLEASAAYVTIVSGQPRFSRASILNMVDELSDEHAYTQEARIKSFGKLLRNGSILRVEDGKFAISHSAKFNYEVKISA